MFLLFCVFLVSVPDVPVEEMQFDVIHLCCGEIFLHLSRHIVEVKTELWKFRAFSLCVKVVSSIDKTVK